MNLVLAEYSGDETLLVTADGYAQLLAELELLTTRARSELSARLREARADGDLADNPALLDALEEQAQLEGRIALLEARRQAACIVVPSSDGTAGIGSRVRLRDVGTGELVEYELVGPIEGNASSGRVSVEAPVGRALVGAGAGDVVAVDAPRGTLRFTVISVDSDGGRAREKAA